MAGKPFHKVLDRLGTRVDCAGAEKHRVSELSQNLSRLILETTIFRGDRCPPCSYTDFFPLKQSIRLRESCQA